MLNYCKYCIYFELAQIPPMDFKQLYKDLAAVHPDLKWEKWLEFVQLKADALLSRTGCEHCREKSIFSLSSSSSLTKINLSLVCEEKYPIGLHHLDKPPIGIFKKSFSDNEMLPRFSSVASSIASSIAIVGSRKADSEGIQIAKSLARELASVGITIISGLAYGIDAAAHWGSLEADSESKALIPTVAVLGSGVDVIYPKAHTRLTKKILSKKGFLISEYLPHVEPRKHFFLQRNRIIAALSAAVIVVQAGKRSGALSTARRALELGRDVFAVPGSVYNSLYAGTNELIKQGAIPITSSKDLFEQLGRAQDFSIRSRKLTIRKKVEYEVLVYLATYGSSAKKELSHYVTSEKELDCVLDLLIREQEVVKKGSRYKLVQ